MRMLGGFLLLCLSLAPSVPRAAAPVLADAAPVEVLALFSGRALLRADGEEHLLKVGERTPDGLVLLEADANAARVRYRQREYSLSLSRRVASTFEAADRQRVAISSDAQGQYRVRGAINDTLVDFLVDTGASVVAMSQVHAQSLGIDWQRADRGAVQTAQGTVGSGFVTLDKVSVGGITAHHVRAAVIDGSFPLDILLGMSFLRQVSMEEKGGVLTLIQQH